MNWRKEHCSLCKLRLLVSCVSFVAPEPKHIVLSGHVPAPHYVRVEEESRCEQNRSAKTTQTFYMFSEREQSGTA